MGAESKTAGSGTVDWGTNLANAFVGIGQTIASGYADKLSGKYAASAGAVQPVPTAPVASYTPSVIALPAQVAGTVPPPAAAAPAISPQMMMIAVLAIVLVIALK